MVNVAEQISWGSSVVLLGLPFLVGVFLSYLLELLLTPSAKPVWRRSFASLCFHVGSIALLYGAELFLFHRPWFAIANVLAIQLLVVLVNNAKFHAMREPFLVHDFEYFTDAIKHPRLYLPFFGIFKTALAVCVFVSVLVIGVMLEDSAVAYLGWSLSIQAWCAVLACSGCLLYVGSKLKAQDLSLIPMVDYKRLGQVSFLWHYGILHFKQPIAVKEDRWQSLLPSDPSIEKLPDVVVVQSESFFDACAEYPVLKRDILAGFDQICESSLCWGALQVPAWGANTIRTESAFLTGTAANDFGVHQFSPYRHFMKHPKRTVAHALRDMGYRTVCIHPYPSSFYLRDQLYPQMGFDDFIDIKAFADSDKSGQYVGDFAVAEKVKSLLNDANDQPLFVFVITMENHGPLHLEKPDAQDKVDLYQSEQPTGCDDLTVYARHLKNADSMAVMLRDTLASRTNGGVMGWYGDHVPIMANVYRQLGMPKGETRYFIWHDQPHTAPVSPSNSINSPRDVSELAEQLFKALTIRYEKNLER